MNEAVTILELAKHRGVKADPDGGLTGEALAAVGLDLLGGGEGCGATLAAYHAFPTSSGYWRCEACRGDTGFATVEAANAAVFGEERPR